MSPSEYQELVEFLNGQFTRIDQRFHDLTLEVDRRFTLVDRRLEGFQTEVDARFREVLGHFGGGPHGRQRAAGDPRA